MIRLLYISTTRTAHQMADLQDILRTSRRNNAAVNVTGLLVAGGRRFLQVLEGPADAVDRVYEHIRRDPRHYAPVILDRRPIDRRLFGAWAMGFQPSAGLYGAGEIADDVAALVASIDDASLKAYFQEFATRHAA